MNKSYRIFLQALLLSFFGHAIFFSLFNVQDIEFEKKGQLLPMTILQMRPRTAGRVEAATSSNPELIDPKLVQIAEHIKRTTAPKLESHRKATVWEEEMASKTFEADPLSWFSWSFRRNMPSYADIFENPAVFASPSISESIGEKTDTVVKPDIFSTAEIQTSFLDRKLLLSTLPKLPADMQGNSIASVRLRVGVSREGKVRFAMPESGSTGMLAAVAANEVRKWRFSPAEGFEDYESAENIEWGWVTVPFEKGATSDILEKNGETENTGARVK